MRTKSRFRPPAQLPKVRKCEPESGIARIGGGHEGQYRWRARGYGIAYHCAAQCRQRGGYAAQGAATSACASMELDRLLFGRRTWLSLGSRYLEHHIGRGSDLRTLHRRSVSAGPCEFGTVLT